MKNYYLNGTLNFGVELGVIQKKNKKKYIVKKTLKKKKILQKIYPHTPFDCVGRKKAWFLALMFESQNVIVD